jgi:hypothetical protein
MAHRKMRLGTWVTQEIQIVKVPSRKMAVVHASGDPRYLANLVLPTLFESVCTLEESLRAAGRDFAVGPLYARWPDVDTLPREEWRCIWALPIPDDVSTLPRINPYVAVEVEVWVYGTVVQLLHVGLPCGKNPALRLLRDFVSKHGYELAGPREEIYLPSYSSEIQDIVIRYPVKRQTSLAADPLAEHRHVMPQASASPSSW